MNDVRPIRAKSGSNHEGTSAHNRRVMIDALRFNGALSRAELARATQLTKQAVSNIIEELERDGFVASLEAVRNGRGQPSRPYRLVPERAFAIGLQIDRYVTRALIVDLVGNAMVRAEANLPSGDPAEGVGVILDLIRRVRAELAARSARSEERIVGLGVAMPGPFGLGAFGGNQWAMPSCRRGKARSGRVAIDGSSGCTASNSRVASDGGAPVARITVCGSKIVSTRWTLQRRSGAAASTQAMTRASPLDASSSMRSCRCASAGSMSMCW